MPFSSPLRKANLGGKIADIGGIEWDIVAQKWEGLHTGGLQGTDFTAFVGGC